jgi:hypothetical protein
MKKIINRLPGGETKLKSIIAALFLIKEYHDSKDRTTSLMEEKYLRLLEKLETENVILVEEEMAVKKFLDGNLYEDGVVTTGPANVTGAGVSTNEPVVRKKDIKKYQNMAKRSVPLTVGTTSVSS